MDTQESQLEVSSVARAIGCDLTRFRTTFMMDTSTFDLDGGTPTWKADNFALVAHHGTFCTLFERLDAGLSGKVTTALIGAAVAEL